MYYSKISHKIFLIFGLLFSLRSLAINEILIEGKTKIVRRHSDDKNLAIFESKDDITAGDGAKHDIIAGKAMLATATTCNVFRLLEACDIPLAFKKQLDEKRFLASYCTMIPYEVVVRREAHGSALKRNSVLQKGHLFPKLVVEFFLKTSDRVWQGALIPKDDPFIRFVENKAELYLPDAPLESQKPFMVLDNFPLQNQPDFFEQMSEYACRSFLALEKAWQLVGGRLVDFKVEFGFDVAGNLLLADVIDNDSWRVIHGGGYIDKQAYRDGADLNKVTQLYQSVAELTSQFAIPKQQIIVWRGSQKDTIDIFLKAFEPFTNCGCQLTTVTLSAHKEPTKCCFMVNKLLKEIPDSVLLAYIGSSNAAGPMLSAYIPIPVINVPACWQNFSDDIWSSLRTPSNVLALTMLDPINALQSALQILSMRNPCLYSKLRFEQEKRIINIIEL